MACRVKKVALGPNELTFHVRDQDTRGAYSVVEWLMAPPPAPGPPRHIHKTEDEALYMVDGELDVTVEAQTTRAKPGAYILVPKGVRHTVANPGPGRARFLVILSPPGYEGYWDEMSELMKAGPLKPEAVLALQLKYNMDAGGQVRRFD